MMGVFMMAVASAGPYANNLHLAPDRFVLLNNYRVLDFINVFVARS